MMKYASKKDQQGFIGPLIGLGIAAAMLYYTAVGIAEVVNSFYKAQRKTKAIIGTAVATLGLTGYVAYDAHNQSEKWIEKQKADASEAAKRQQDETERQYNEIVNFFAKQLDPIQKSYEKASAFSIPEKYVAECYKKSVAAAFVKVTFKTPSDNTWTYDDYLPLNDKFRAAMRGINVYDCNRLSTSTNHNMPNSRYNIDQLNNLRFGVYLASGMLVPGVEKENNKNAPKTDYALGHFIVPTYIPGDSNAGGRSDYFKEPRP